jgi:transposase-like protein
MDCPRCSSQNHSKDGIIKGCQRYKCKDCNYHYTVEKKSNVKPVEMKRIAFELYLEGLGFRSIGRILRISYGTVYQWVRRWSKQMELPERNDRIEMVELDEMHTYVGQKKTTTGYGLLLIDMESGTSLLSVETGRQGQD